MEENSKKVSAHSHCAVIVAHPDDETLWAGSTILMNPDNKWVVVTLCRRVDLLF